MSTTAASWMSASPFQTRIQPPGPPGPEPDPAPPHNPPHAPGVPDPVPASKGGDMPALRSLR